MILRGTGIHRHGRRGVGSPAEVTGFIVIAGCRFRRYHRWKRSVSVSRRSKRSLHEFVPCQTGSHRGRRGVGSPAEVTGFIVIAGCRFRRYHRQKRSVSVSRRSKRSLHEFVPCQTGSHRGRGGVGSPAEVTGFIAIAGCRFRRYHRQKRSLSVSLRNKRSLPEFVPCQTGSHRGRRGVGSPGEVTRLITIHSWL